MKSAVARGLATKRPMLALAVAGSLAAGALTFAAGPSQSPSFTGNARVAQGELAGVAGRNSTVTVFRGVPYAAAPVGARRWKAPEAAAPWSGVRQARGFSHGCVQTIVEGKRPWTYEFMAHDEVSEDCLYLNVWTSARSATERRPVIVFIHGGANVEGSGSVPVYDGEGLAQKGLVVVTINYRLGIFGFLAHPELTKEASYGASGNYGLLDQIAAVRWVRENAAAFGGDPDRITIAGQSAGASGVHHLTASPLARGTFHRAIAQSGSTLGLFGTGRSLRDQETDGVRFATAKGAASLAALRAMTWQELFAPLPQGAAGSGPLRWGPVVDGHVLPASIGQMFSAGRQNDVPTLTGANADENGASPNPTATMASFTAQARQRYGADADAFLALYPASTDAEARAAQNASARDLARVNMYLWALERAKTAKTSTYTYFFTQVLPGPEAATFGAFHTAEVPYALDTLTMSPRVFSDADRALADRMSSYWANFAANGNPNHDGLPHWPAVAERPETTMALGNEMGPIPVAGSAAKTALLIKLLRR